MFLKACSLPPDERDEYVRKACAGAPGLRARLDALLVADEMPDEIFKAESVGGGVNLGHHGPPGGGVGTGTPEYIDEYKITGLLGEGATAIVYLAEQPVLDRPVALKVLKTPLVSPSTYQRFEKEARTLSLLRHPGIAAIYTAGTSTQGPLPFAYVAMEYVCDARSLVKYAAEEQLLVWDRMALFLKVCEAVRHGHEQGVVHRDLKPPNILVDADGNVKIVDFGIAKIMVDSSSPPSPETFTYGALGTPPYASPEQLDCEEVDERTDVYSLGIVLYELLCRIPPFKIWKLGLARCRKAIDTQTPPRPSEVNQDFSGELEEIILKAMNRNREHRYPSVAELCADIERFLGSQPAGGSSAGLAGSRASSTVHVQQIREQQDAPPVRRKDEQTVSNPHHLRDRKILESNKYDLNLVFNEQTVFIVTGAGLDIELLDRPIAEKLRDAIDKRGNLDSGRRAVVTSDESFLADRAWRKNPHISVGGPKPNTLTNRINSEIPNTELVKQAYMARDSRRVALWGEGTTDVANAVDAFIKKHLDAWLAGIWPA